MYMCVYGGGAGGVVQAPVLHIGESDMLVMVVFNIGLLFI